MFFPLENDARWLSFTEIAELDRVAKRRKGPEIIVYSDRMKKASGKTSGKQAVIVAAFRQTSRKM